MQMPERRALLVVFIAILVSVFVVMPAGRAAAQTPDIEAHALAIERTLLCPQCTNLRLDVCDTQLCSDMRAEIRERLVRGESTQQITDSFTERYGVRVLADVPATGFNRLLFVWVGGSLLLVAAVGGFVLVRLRRTASPAPEIQASDTADDAWLDDQLAADREAR